MLTLIFLLNMSFSNFSNRQETDLNKCLIKYKSEWGKPCLQCKESAKSYRVYFRSSCDQKIDVKLAAQEADKRWKTFVMLSVNPSDTLLAYACNGTGKYLYWVRHAGDATVEFPTDDQINSNYHN